MRIYFNGDSHTSGSELNNPKEETYSYVLAKLLNAEIVSNPAVGGASNYRINRLTDNFLDESIKIDSFPDLVVIGWSEPHRYDWFYNGAYRSVASADDGLDPNKLASLSLERSKTKTYLEELRYQNMDYFSYYISLFHHEMIYNLHLRLKHLNIKHLFFNGCNGFCDWYTWAGPDYPNELLNFPKYDWENCFWRPYDTSVGSLISWAKSNNYYITDWQHTTAEAHAEFASILKSYMTEHKIV